MITLLLLLLLRSSSMVTAGRPPTRSSLKITYCSFRLLVYAMERTDHLIIASLVRYSLLHFHRLGLSHMTVHHVHYHHYLLYIKNLISSQTVDLSAAFDTIDHNILLTCLSSWFGIQGSALDWFKSYLSSHSLRVKCNNFSSCHFCICGVPECSVLGPLLLYTTPLSTLISSVLEPPTLC